MKNSTKTNFDFDSFRTDINNNEKFEFFKAKYGLKNRKELDLKLLELMRKDNKFYSYSPDPVIREEDVFLSKGKDRFLKVAARVVEGYKEYLKLDQLSFDGYEFQKEGLLLKVKVS